jgi:hypothetical protein
MKLRSYCDTVGVTLFHAFTQGARHPCWLAPEKIEGGTRWVEPTKMRRLTGAADASHRVP